MNLKFADNSLVNADILNISATARSDSVQLQLMVLYKFISKDELPNFINNTSS